MFNMDFGEMLVIAVVAIVIIGPKDLPMALRTIGRWTAKVRRVSGHFRSGIETMIREAELEEMERKWREQNEAIIKAHPDAPVDENAVVPASAEAALPLSVLPPPSAKADAMAQEAEAGQQLPAPPP